MNKKALLLVLIAFIIGIIVEYLWELHWIILLTIWSALVVLFIIFNALSSKLITARKWVVFQFLFLFFISGMLGLSLRLPGAFDDDFTKHYLTDDYLIGEITDFQKGNNNFDRAIVAINSVVSYYDRRKVQGKLLCYIRKGENHFELGDIIQFQPDIQSIENKNNPGEFDAEMYWKKEGIVTLCFIDNLSILLLKRQTTFFKFWEQSRHYLIKIINQYISPENQGSVIGITLGDKSQLSRERMHQYANAGAMHLLAVSGLHIGILLRFLEWFFGKFSFLRKKNSYFYCAIGTVWIICLLTGMSASVLRAALMFTILGFGHLFGKSYFGLHAIFLSALLLLLFNPFYLFDIGFQLSYLAMIGISLFYLPIANLFKSKYKFIDFTWQGIAIGLAAEIVVVPISLFYFHQFPNYFILTNIGVTFLAFACMVSAVVFLALSFVPYLVYALAFVVDVIFGLLNAFIAWINTLPAPISTGFSPNLLQLIGIYICILLFYFYFKRKDNVGLRIVGGVIFIVSLSFIVGRMNNKSEHRLIICNDYRKVILVKENHQLFAFYDANKVADHSELMFLLSGYQKMVGLKAYLFPVYLREKIKLNENITIVSKEKTTSIHYYGATYTLVSNFFSKKSASANLVKGAWSPYTEIPTKFNTINGALILKPEMDK